MSTPLELGPQDPEGDKVPVNVLLAIAADAERLGIEEGLNVIEGRLPDGRGLFIGVPNDTDP